MVEKIKCKAIYQPTGKAGEYAKYACNFYVGCSNACTYCYCKKGILAQAMGNDTPTLKKCFRDDNHAIEVFEKELKANISELQQHGLFFSFTTDPCLSATINLTIRASKLAISRGVPVKILTKCADGALMLGAELWLYCKEMDCISMVAIGFTLTGHDELELYASTNAERIDAMKKLHDAGFKTWASIEPIVDFDSSRLMIEQTTEFCDLYKIGLMSGQGYPREDVRAFVEWAINRQSMFYFKDSLLKSAGIDRKNLSTSCVGADYNIFENI